MSLPREQLWTLLLNAGVVAGELPAATDRLESPWYVKVLLAISGWIASLFLLVFLGFLLIEVFDAGALMFITGGIVIALTYALMRAAKNEFVQHLALAGSLAGQVLMVFAIYDFTKHESILFWQLVTLLQILLALLVPNFIHRVLTVIAATISYTVMMNKMGLSGLVTGSVLLFATLCWLNEFRFSKYMSVFRASGYGLVLAMLLFKTGAMYSFIMHDFIGIYSYSEPILPRWVGELLIALVMLYLVWRILRHYYSEILSAVPAVVLMASLLLSIASMEMPGLNVGIAILLLGFLGSNRILMSFGIVLLLFHISTYYYFMEATLLDKSQSLLIIGIVLFFIRWFMRYGLDKIKGAEHA